MYPLMHSNYLDGKQTSQTMREAVAVAVRAVVAGGLVVVDGILYNLPSQFWLLTRVEFYTIALLGQTGS